MPDTSGLSFYQTDDTTSKSITYGFEVLSPDDITVIATASNNTKTVLRLESEIPAGDGEVGYGYTVNLATKTVTMTAASWHSHPLIYASSSIRVFRTTSVIPLIDFKSGAVLSEGDLDMAYKQGLFAAQEMTEDAADTSAGLQSVTTGVIAPGAVTGPKIAPNAIAEDRLIDGAVTSVKIQDDAINAAKIQDGTVGSSELAAACVTENKLGNLSVTETKIGNEAVTQNKVTKASKGYMETQSENYGVVTPDVLKYSPFSPRCYGFIDYNNTGADALGPESWNVDTSATTAEVNTARRRKIFFDTDLSSTNYTVIATFSGAAGSDGRIFILDKQAGSFVIYSDDVSETTARGINFIVFGSSLSA
tara:strand:+ start:1361 stop:2449 length:1089 start_codon:yes stop_codon:yes gene_type:complete